MILESSTASLMPERIPSVNLSIDSTRRSEVLRPAKSAGVTRPSASSDRIDTVETRQSSRRKARSLRIPRFGDNEANLAFFVVFLSIAPCSSETSRRLRCPTVLRARLRQLLDELEGNLLRTIRARMEGDRCRFVAVAACSRGGRSAKGLRLRTDRPC